MEKENGKLSLFPMQLGSSKAILKKEKLYGPNSAAQNTALVGIKQKKKSVGWRRCREDFLQLVGLEYVWEDWKEFVKDKKINGIPGNKIINS